MLSIQINGVYIDLPKGKSVDFEKTSTLFDNETIRGSSSLAIEIPWTDLNKRTLGFVADIENDRPFYYRYECTVYYDNIRYTKGTFILKSSTETVGKGAVIFDSLGKRIKDIKLGSFNYGGERVITDPGNRQAMVDHARITTRQTIANCDYVFVPLYNPDLYGDARLTAGAEPADYMNFEYSKFKIVNPFLIYSDQELASIHPNAWAATPYPYLITVLRFVMAELGYTIKGPFVDNPEIQTAIIYNTFILDDYVKDEMANEINRIANKIHLKNHVPDITVKEFLDALRHYFCLSIEVDTNAKTVSFNYRDDSLFSEVKQPIGQYYVRGYEKIEAAVRGYTFSQLTDNSDEIFKSVKAEHIINDGSEKIDVKVGFLIDAPAVIPFNKNVGYRLPYAFQKGTSQASYYNGDSSEHILGTNDFEFRILFYRGHVKSSVEGITYPYATSGNKDMEGNQLGALTMNFLDPEFGGFNLNWRNWIEFMFYTTKIERNLVLPFDAVNNLKIYDHLTDHTSKYLLESIKFDMAAENKDLIQAQISMFKINKKPVHAELGDGTLGEIIIIPPQFPQMSIIYAEFKVLDNAASWENSDYRYIYKDYWVHFYSDPGGVIPIQVKNLTIKYQATNTVYERGQQTNQMITEQNPIVCNGSKFLVYEKFPYDYLKRASFWSHSFQRTQTLELLPGNGYETINR